MTTALLWLAAGTVGIVVLDDLRWPLAASAGIAVGLVLGYPLYVGFFRLGVWFGERGQGRPAAIATLGSLLSLGFLPPIRPIEIRRVRTLGNLAWACHLADWRRLRALAAHRQLRRAMALATRDSAHMLLVAQAYAAEAGRLVDRGWLVAALDAAEFAEQAYQRAGAFANPYLRGEAEEVSLTVVHLRRAVGQP
jgi:hypothetical protein